jgi:hypothetical protein
VATSTLRAVILVAAVVLGVFGIAKAFSGDATQALAPAASGHPSPGASPSPSASSSPRSLPSPAKSRKPRVRGVVVEVLNGSGKTGQASLTSQTLANAGYTVKPPGNSPHIATTTVYYAANAKVDAEGLRDRYFPGAELQPAPASFPAGVDVEVVLGQDFGASPSPSAS